MASIDGSISAPHAPVTVHRLRGWSMHLLLPGVGFVLLWLALVPHGVDGVLERGLFELQGGAWALRHHWLTEQVMHDGGRALSAALWLCVVTAALLAGRLGLRARQRRGLVYLATCVLLSVLLVSATKRLSAADCPWDMPAYGAPASLDHAQKATGHCFPAGHASSGYAWLALYFAAGSKRRRRLGLAFGLGLGLLFGIAQQLRGAHFLSHDLWAAALCWSVTLACLPLLRRRAGREAGT